jgi:hypothetical protein
MSNNIQKIKIKGVDIILENTAPNQGKIIVSDNNGNNYSMFWGAMGSTLQEFLCGINSSYFSDKLLGSERSQTFNVKKTFKELRKFIREDLDLPWYKHLEFQKDFREKLKSFENECLEYPYDRFFVDGFQDCFSVSPNFYLIDDSYERSRIEKDFKSISELWHFIQTSESDTCKWLQSIHKQLIKKLNCRVAVS